MGDFKRLEVWQRAHQLTLVVYRVTEKFPKTEIFGLTSQMRRCAVSIGSNIAEGMGRRGDAELARFLRIAVGSANELEYQLLLSRDLGYVAEEFYKSLDREVCGTAKMLVGLLNTVEQRVHKKSFSSI